MGLGNSEDVAVDDGDGADASGGKAFGESAVPCSICLEVVAGNGDRSLAKLQCGHQFHLDCIGSAFNAKGAMQCPNCRKIEKGQWLYANGCRSFPEFSMEDWTRDEDLYDLSYSEMSYGVHWCPFGQLARIPSSFEEEEFSSTAYHDLLGQHAIFSEPTPVSSATHPCPYIAYFGPVHPSSSSSTGSVSDSSNFSNHWNDPSEVPTPYAFPGMDLHYRSGEHHHHHQPSIPAVAPRSARANSEISRSGSVMHHPFLVGHSSAARPGSSVGSSMIPPYPGSNARARDRVQALQAYYQQQQPSNARAPVVSGTRRSSSNRRVAQPGPVALPSSDQNAGFYYFQSGASGHNFQEPENQISNHFHAWGRDHLPSFSLNQVDREFGWGAFHHQAAGGSDSSSSLRQRHGSERTPSQNRS